MKNLKQITKLIIATVSILIITSCGNSNAERIEQLRLKESLITEQKRQEENRIKEEKRQEELQLTYIRAINSVLIADSKASVTSGGDYALTSKKMRNIDLTQCPRDFASAYIEHIHAWEGVAKIKMAQIRLREQDESAATAGLIATLLEMEASPFSNHLKAEEELNKLLREKRNEITTTWNKIEVLAVSYGGTLPQ